jgi:hypothetical protein
MAQPLQERKWNPTMPEGRLERTRMAYHTLTARKETDPSRDCFILSYSLSRFEQMSWVSQQTAARAIAERVYTMVMEVERWPSRLR